MRPETSRTRVKPDSFAALVSAYLASDQFRAYPKSTQKTWGVKLRYASHPETLGSLSVKEIRASLVQRFLDGFSASPYSQAIALAAIRRVEKWALVRDLLPHPISVGCETGDADGGHVPWTDEQVALAVTSTPPHISRIIILAANTGQRGSDLVKMRWTDLEVNDGALGINVLQTKTGKQTFIPFMQELRDAIGAWERRPGHILRRPDGLPWGSRDTFSQAWTDERNSNQALAPLRAVPYKGKTKPLVLHGLRGTCCVRLLRRGATTREVSEMIGMSEQMVKRYTRFSEQKKNAVAALFRLEGTPREQSLFGPSKNRA